MELENQLTRYENKYFNCSHSLLISYLNELKYPVELLLYRSLENTQRIYNHFIRHGGAKWSYPYDILSNEDLLKLHIRSNCRRSVHFGEVELEIQTLLHAGQPVFLSVDMFHLQHKTEQYKQSSLPHTVMLVHYIDSRRDVGYQLFDDDHKHASDYNRYFYPRHVIEEGFDSPASEHAFISLQLSPPDLNAAVDETSQAWVKWLAAYDDDLQYYESLQSFLSDLSRITPLLLVDISERWCASLALITASRKIFARYLRSVNGPARSIEQLLTAAKHSEIIKNQLRRKVALSHTDTASLIDRCAQLKRLEGEMVTSLKDFYL
ncbi:hypothetical protein [Paenibacillus xylaniclasticus]|uniref:hypothetical protein n=1 Tax=Paenibacillus xylaniclasticus TaxID=588083 RepID=UPI000FD70803|nr:MULTISPECIES: hypothetical protein [Paenibacillus]